MLVYFIILFLLFYTKMGDSVSVVSKQVNVRLTKYFMYVFYRKWLIFVKIILFLRQFSNY